MEFLELFVARDHLESNDDLFGLIDDFFVHKMAALPCLFFSHETKAASAGNSPLHILWNKEKIDKHYSFEDMNVVNGKIAEIERGVSWKFISVTGRDYFCFHVGDESAQKIWGVVACNAKIVENKEKIDSFVRFINNSFNNVKKWKATLELNALAYVDDISGLANQRKMKQDLDTYIERYNREGAEFSFLFIDVDHFKDVNDNHGHLVGTQLLKELGELFESVLRDSDFLYRYGGDEFVVILSEEDADYSTVIGQRLIDKVKSTPFFIDDKRFDISVSIGVASFPQNARNRNEIIEIADKMMYHAKKTGRGRVCLATDYFNK